METAQTKSGSKEIVTINAQSVTTPTGCVEDQDDGTAYDTIPKPTILGARLIGTPYSVATMQQASLNLYGASSGITENKWYVRFKPADTRQLSILDNLNLDLFDYPLDYEVTQQGDYYDDGVTPAETIPWLYTVVPANFVFPSGIQYELLQRMHVPTLASLEREAFRITGNPVPDTTCGAIVNGATKDGGVSPNIYQGPCPYECDDPRCKNYSQPCSGTPPPPTPVPSPSPTREPSGTVLVFDTNRGANVPVRNVEVIIKGFLHTERTFTNDQGQYFTTKEFNKANIYIRTKNAQASIRALRRARLWQILLPVEVHFGKFKGRLSGLQHNIDFNADARSKGAKQWTAATANNKVQEYYDWATQQQIGVPPKGIKVLLTNWRNTGGATPMFAKRFWQTLPTDFVTTFVIANGSAVAGGLTALAVVLKDEVDITAGYNTSTIANPDRTKGSDAMAELLYHELTHGAHYNKVGNAWWKDFVDAQVGNIINRSNPPYGTGTQGATSDLIALGESWAYHMGHFYSDRKYGTISSDAVAQRILYQNNSIIAGSSHINLLEDFSTDRLNDPDRWIPQGLYYDLIDDRNDLTATPFRVGIDDQVKNYTNQRFFGALDSDIRSLRAFQTRLLSESSNDQAAGVNTIFNFYVR